MAEWKKVIVSGSTAELHIVSASRFHGSLEGSLTDGNGIADFTYDGSANASVTVELDGSTLALGSGGVKVADGGVDTTQLASNAVTTAKITDANVTLAKLANAAANTVIVRDANSSGVLSAKAVTDTQILIGDGTGFTAAALSGDVTMTNAGAVTIANNAVETAMIGDEQVTLAKLAHAAANTVLVRDANSAGDPSFKTVANTQILIGDGTGFTAAALSGDVTMTNAGAVTIANDAVETAMIAHSLGQAGVHAFTGSFSGSFVGDGSNLTGISADSFDFDSLDAVTSLNQGDIFGVSVSGTEKKITYSNLEDDIFGNLSGDVSVAAGGAVSVNSVQANSVALGTDTTGNYVQSLANATNGGTTITNGSAEGGAATVALNLNDLSAAAVSVANDSIAIIDADDNTSKKESIADLASAMANTGITAAGGRFSTDDSAIVHDNLSGFVANEHIDHSGVSITAGAGLTGGGTIAATRTLSVDSGSMVAYYSSSIFSTLSGDISVTAAGVATVTGAVTNAALTDGNGIADFSFNGSGAASVAIDLDGSTLSVGASGLKISTGGVDTTQLAADAVNGDKIANDAIDSEHYADGSIDTAHIANDAVTGDKLANDITIAGNLTVTSDLTVNGTTTTLSTTNLNVEDKYILLHSGSSGTADSGVIFGGTSGTDGQGKAIIWDASYNTNDGRLAVSTTDVTAESTSNFGAGTAGYYVAGVFEGNETDAATAKADHNGNIRIESNEIYIYA